MSAPATLPRVVIVGAGFGGLWAAKTLANAPVEVVVIDRQNYHLFQPLLYQVATAALSPADIAAPIRSIVSTYRNVTVIPGTVEGVDVMARDDLLAPGRHVRFSASDCDSPFSSTDDFYHIYEDYQSASCLC